MNFVKPNNWNTDEYLFYLYSNKDEFELSWQDIANIMNKYEDRCYKEDRYRKYCKMNFNCDRGFEKEVSEFKETNTDELTIEEKFDIAKETQRLRDERTQLNALYRQMTREDYLRDIAVECAKVVSEKKPLVVLDEKKDAVGHNEGILLLSDWHYGICIDNHWNKYNPDICRERLSKLMLEVKKLAFEYDIYKINIVNLGDLISGRIHSQIRIENREDVVSQVMDVAELLTDFIFNLYNYGLIVDYYDCLDNHSRIEPNKKESLRLESLARIITWYLESRFDEFDRVNIRSNEYSDDIITFKSNDWLVAGVHGDLDTQKNVVRHMRGMISERPDLICTAHMHHFSADEENNCVVISNPSLMGTDQFAESKRYTSYPAQTFIVSTSESPVDSIHRIILP